MVMGDCVAIFTPLRRGIKLDISVDGLPPSFALLNTASHGIARLCRQRAVPDISGYPDILSLVELRLLRSHFVPILVDRVLGILSF